MRFFLDTEFNGYQGELISIALVGDDGSEWYKVLTYDQHRIVTWVDQNVVPVLAAPRTKLASVQLSLQAFLSGYQSRHMHVIADWPDDIKHFCDLLIYGPGKRLTTTDITFHLMYGMGDTATTSTIPHNALEDAKALRAMFRDRHPATALS